MTNAVIGSQVNYGFTAAGALLPPTATENYAVNSKGCMPQIAYGVGSSGGTGAAASGTAPTIFGATASAASGADATIVASTADLAFGLGRVVAFHCVTNGVCCVTNLCNGSIKIGLNLFNIVLLLASLLILKASF